MATAPVIRSAPAACSSATASMLYSKGRADDAQPTSRDVPGSPASDVPDSPMAPTSRSSPTLAPPPFEPLKLTPSVQGDRFSTGGSPTSDQVSTPPMTRRRRLQFMRAAPAAPHRPQPFGAMPLNRGSYGGTCEPHPLARSQFRFQIRER